MAIKQVADGVVLSEIFAYGGIEARLAISQLPAGYVAKAYCPYCGQDIGGGKSAANENSAALQIKLKFHDHFGHCPIRNADRPPLGVRSA